MADFSTEKSIGDSVSKNFIPLFLASTAFACFAAAFRNRIPNVHLYAASSLIFFTVYFACRLPGKLSWEKLPSPISHNDYAVAAGAIITAVMLLLNFFCEGQPDQGADFNESLFRYQIPLWTWFLLLAATTAAACLLISILGKGGMRPTVRLLISLPYIFLLSCTVWVPNIFYSHYIFFHAHPYYSSIYDVLNLAPLGELDTPLYGHYALLFLLPCKLLGLLGVPHNIAAATMTASCNIVILLAVLYTIHTFVKNDGVFIIALLSLGDVYLMYVQKLFYVKDVYLQTIPHRVMFPALTCALMVAFSGKKLDKGKIAVLYLLAALSFLWNPETGLACIATISLYVFLSEVSLRRFVLCAVLSFASVLAGWLVVLLYDYAVNGQGVSFRSFMYPVMGQFKGIAVQSPMPHPLRTWIPVTIFLLAATGVSTTRFIKRQGSREKSSIFLCTAMLALGLLTYFMNNPVQLNLTIVFFPVVILLAALLDFLLSGEAKSKATRGMSIVILTVMATFALGNVGLKEVLTDRRTTAWRAKNLASFARTLDSEIPAGTLSFGWGVSDLFAAISRDPGVHVLDWVNIMYDKNPIFLNHVNSLVEQADSFFANEDSAALLPASKDFAITREYEYMGWKFALYTRK